VNRGIVINKYSEYLYKLYKLISPEFNYSADDCYQKEKVLTVSRMGAKVNTLITFYKNL